MTNSNSHMTRDLTSSDAPAKRAEPTDGTVPSLAVYATMRAPVDNSHLASPADSLPALQIVDGSSPASTQNDGSGKPGFFTRLANGTAGVVDALATGAADKSASIYHSAVNGGTAALQSVESVYSNRDQIASSIASGIGSGIHQAVEYSVALAEHPVDSIVKAGAVAASVSSTVADGLVDGASATWSGAKAAGSWVANHKLETTAMVGAAAVEAFSVGTATPVLAGLAGLGAAGTVSGVFSLGDHLNEHAADIAVLANPNAPDAQRQQASTAIADATGGDTLALATALTGVGAAKLIGAVRGAAPAAQVLDSSKPVVSSADATASTSGDIVQATHAPPVPEAVHPSGQAADVPPASETAHPAGSDKGVQSVKGADAPPALDASGRPLADGNAERVALQHPPLTAAELAAQRAAVENDLGGLNGSNGQTILEQFKASNLSPAQQDRVLNVLAETRDSYMRPGADGNVSPEQLGSYRHTLGELKAGLESAKANGLNSSETQDALLAGMLSDSHKAGWSASTGGNFFTHHLDGALAADTILGRQLGDGFDAKDLSAVRQAILEHQISPPGFMANAYTSELRAGMKRAGVTPTAEDEQSIDNIRRMMADPLRSASEPDGNGGYRLAYTPLERQLLKQYVGEGTQNWYVPPPAGAEAALSPGDLNVDKISAVTRAADIDDNYSAETDAAGRAIRGPFKIAGLRGPKETPPDLSLDAATQALRNNMKQSESLLTNADLARLASPERQAAADSVYQQARARVGDWLTQQLGHPPDASTPYWGKPLDAPPVGASPQDMSAWRSSADVKLAQSIQQKFADELYEMRRSQ